MKHEKGTIILTLTTGADGRVIKASAAVPAEQKESLPITSKTCVLWALKHWHGPPNATRRTKVEVFLP